MMAIISASPGGRPTAAAPSYEKDIHHPLSCCDPFQICQFPELVRFPFSFRFRISLFSELKIFKNKITRCVSVCVCGPVNNRQNWMFWWSVADRVITTLFRIDRAEKPPSSLWLQPQRCQFSKKFKSPATDHVTDMSGRKRDIFLRELLYSIFLFTIFLSHLNKRYQEKIERT